MLACMKPQVRVLARGHWEQILSAMSAVLFSSTPLSLSCSSPRLFFSESSKLGQPTNCPRPPTPGSHFFPVGFLLVLLILLMGKVLRADNGIYCVSLWNTVDTSVNMKITMSYLDWRGFFCSLCSFCFSFGAGDGSWCLLHVECLLYHWATPQLMWLFFYKEQPICSIVIMKEVISGLLRL